MHNYSSKVMRGVNEAIYGLTKVLTLMVLSDEALNSISPAIHNAHTGPYTSRQRGCILHIIPSSHGHVTDHVTVRARDLQHDPQTFLYT